MCQWTPLSTSVCLKARYQHSIYCSIIPFPKESKGIWSYEIIFNPFVLPSCMLCGRCEPTTARPIRSIFMAIGQSRRSGHFDWAPGFFQTLWLHGLLMGSLHFEFYGLLARYVKLCVAHAPGMPGTFSPPPRVSDSDKHHGTCVTHVPWRMPGSLASGFLCQSAAGKPFPAFPAHAQPAILCIW